ncbi:MAG TPA: hypothetical protein VIC56_02590 [Gemmatimonadota bacterium]
MVPQAGPSRADREGGAGSLIPVALVTCRRLPDLTSDDRLLLEPLRERGIAAGPVVWDDPGADWSRYAGVVVRSPWDYHVKPLAFGRWIDRVERSGVPLWNPPAVLRWNLHKSYLEELAGEGAAVVPTRRLRRGRSASLRQVMDETGWTRAVVKPAISAGARRTMLVDRAGAQARERAVRTLLSRVDVLVQPYVAAVAELGEWSVVFLDGAYSHSALKRPCRGDFRVQERFGGSYAAAEPPPELVDQARRVAEAGRSLAARHELGGHLHGAVQPSAGERRGHPDGGGQASPNGRESDLLYARVDGVYEDGVFTLLELEVLEPSLFFELEPGSADRFADALAGRVARRPTTPAPGPRPSATLSP